MGVLWHPREPVNTHGQHADYTITYWLCILCTGNNYKWNTVLQYFLIFPTDPKRTSIPITRVSIPYYVLSVYVNVNLSYSLHYVYYIHFFYQTDLRKLP